MASRRNPVVRARPDGDFDLVLPREHCDVMVRLLDELEELLTAAPHDPSTKRLRPPAYLDDPERDQGYQLLAGEELRSSRQAAIDASTDALARERLTAEELWAWAQSLNALRLVVGTRLGIEDDYSVRHHEPADPEAALWDVLDFCSEVQHWIIKALGG